MTKQRESTRRGSRFEARVRKSIKRLEKLGFARDLKSQDYVKDRDGNLRKVDLPFVLSTWAVEILISVECKSRNKPISLDQVDQIKVFKNELPERNIFWLVIEGDAGENVKIALESAGISLYNIADLERIIDHMCQNFRKSGIKRLRRNTNMLSIMNPTLYEVSASQIKSRELLLLEELTDVCDVLSQHGIRDRQEMESFMHKLWERLNKR